MNAKYVVLASVLIGVCLGAGIGWHRFAGPPPFELVAADIQVAEDSDKSPQVSVDHEVHDFGEVRRDVRVSHDFRFTNIGKSTLILESAGTTCVACSNISPLTKPRVEPGETAIVTVEVKPTTDTPRLSQKARIKTNDPRRPLVELDFFGVVVSDYSLIPSVANFSQVSVDQSRSVRLTLAADIPDTVQIVRHEVEPSDIAQNFEVTYTPVALDALDPKGGPCYYMNVTLKPGLPLGQFRQRIFVELFVKGRKENPKVEFFAEGVVDSDISIVGGSAWDAKRNRLSMGEVKSAQGGKREVQVYVRGSDRAAVEVTVAKVDPPWLKVTLGERHELSTGMALRIPLTIEIPPGRPPANYAGTEQARYAQVVLETTHPKVKEVPINVQFVIE